MGSGGFLGKVTDFVGLTDYSGAEDRANQATAATAAATGESLQIARENIAFQKQQFAFQKEQYADWKNVYGDIQQNIGEYYKNLSGDTLAARGLQTQALEYNRAMTEGTQQWAQRGLSGSGAEAAAIVAANMQSAGQRAQIRAGADDAAVKEKMAFLGLGLGQGTQMLGTITNASQVVGNASNTASNNVLQGGIAQGQMMNQYAMGTQSGSYGITSGLISATGGVAGGLASAGFFSDERLKTNIVFDREIEGIKFYTWEWTDEAISIGAGSQDTYGVLAQEVISIYPEVVIDNGNYFTIDYKTLYSKLGV